MNNFVLVTYDFSGINLALRLMIEGSYNVFVCVLTPKEAHKTIKKEEDEIRTRIGDGLLKKIDSSKIFQLNPEETIVIFDNNLGWEIGEELIKRGYRGIIPTKDDFELERNREYAYKVVSEIFDGYVKIPEFQVFNSVNEAINFLKKRDEVFVIKSDGDLISTYVPQSNDVDEARKLNIQMLLSYEEEYNKSKIILQRKIINGIEFIPDILFDVNMENYLSSVSIEDKYFGDGLTGKQVGCAGEIGFFIKEETQLFREIVSHLKRYSLEKRKQILDVGIIFDKDSNDYYFTEFCPRLGWGHTHNLISIMGSVGNFIKFLTEGVIDESIYDKISVGITLFNTFERGINRASILIPYYNENVCPYDIMMIKKGKFFVTSGYGDESLYFVASSEKRFLYQMIDDVERTLKRDIWKSFYWRRDLFSPFNEGGIISRFEWLLNSYLLEKDLLLNFLEKTYE